MRFKIGDRIRDYRGALGTVVSAAPKFRIKFDILDQGYINDKDGTTSFGQEPNWMELAYPLIEDTRNYLDAITQSLDKPNLGTI